MLKMKQKEAAKVAPDYLGIKPFEWLWKDRKWNSQERSLNSRGWEWYVWKQENELVQKIEINP